MSYPSTLPRSVRIWGRRISGFIGFDLLGMLVVKIDYRDGLDEFRVLGRPGIPARALTKNKKTVMSRSSA